ncbi:hypothetical protein, conserved [Leishmania tarentolae]|uniref:Chromosomal passenger protein n=1 Tax=Leishmania tarentolae TaxID=5689 RepID=A0A640KPS8_LEITA|nr:hypothetical protein, conserved [Leishmania tarentolae]
MPGYRSDIDPFKEIRVLPREAAQLRHHLSRINHTLQTKYFVAAELSELALQPDRSDEFLDLYKAEINRVVARLNTNGSKQYTVTVDPLRLTTGFELKRGVDRKGNLRAATTEANVDEFIPSNMDARWAASLVETSRQLAQQQAIDSNRQALSSALQSTPSSQQTQGLKGAGVSTVGADTMGDASTCAIDSDVRKANKESFLFSTPPEFTGFAPSSTSPGVP